MSMVERVTVDLAEGADTEHVIVFLEHGWRRPHLDQFPQAQLDDQRGRIDWVGQRRELDDASVKNDSQDTASPRSVPAPAACARSTGRLRRPPWCVRRSVGGLALVPVRDGRKAPFP